MVGERQEQKSPLRRSKFLPFLSSFSGSDMPCADKSSGGTAGRQPLHLTPGPPTVLPSLLLIAFWWEEVRWAQPTLTWKNRHGFTLGGFCVAFIHLQDHTRCHHSNLCSWGSVTGGCWCWPGKQLCAGPVARLASCSFRSPCLAMLSTPLTHPHPGLLPSQRPHHPVPQEPGVQPASVSPPSWVSPAGRHPGNTHMGHSVCLELLHALFRKQDS